MNGLNGNGVNVLNGNGNFNQNANSNEDNQLGIDVKDLAPYIKSKKNLYTILVNEGKLKDIYCNFSYAFSSLNVFINFYL